MLSVVSDNHINQHLSKFDLNVKTRGPLPRPFDQKIQPDVLSINACCILNYVKTKKHFFTVNDVWKDPWSKKYVYENTRKGDSTKKDTFNEFDKYFGQPFCFLTYFGILYRIRKGRSFQYTILNKKILEYISFRSINSYEFLLVCIKRFLLKNNINEMFDNFFKEQDSSSYNDLKDGFSEFLWANTNITRGLKNEPGRWFTPIINPLAYSKDKKGTEKGRMSKDPVTFDDLIYNRSNWRDDLDKKPKRISRKEWKKKHLEDLKEEKAFNGIERRAKNNIEKRHGNISEFSKKDNAVHTHHIFPRHDFEDIYFYEENLIRITPDEHLVHAHPNGQTKKIDKEFQAKLLFAKLKSVKESMNKGDNFYKLPSFIEVLNKGYKVSLPTSLNVNDVERFLNSRGE